MWDRRRKNKRERERMSVFLSLCVCVCVMERKTQRHKFKGYVWWGTLFPASWTLNDARTGTSVFPSDALALLMLSLTNHTCIFLPCLFFFLFTFLSKQYVMVWMFGSYDFMKLYPCCCSISTLLVWWFLRYLFLVARTTIFPCVWIVELQQVVDKVYE